MAVHVQTDRNLPDMLTKGLPVEVRNKLDAIVAQIAAVLGVASWPRDIPGMSRGLVASRVASRVTYGYK